MILIQDSLMLNGLSPSSSQKTSASELKAHIVKMVPIQQKNQLYTLVVLTVKQTGNISSKYRRYHIHSSHYITFFFSKFFRASN